jgi:hypothetical protein
MRAGLAKWWRTRRYSVGGQKAKEGQKKLESFSFVGQTGEDLTFLGEIQKEKEGVLNR